MWYHGLKLHALAFTCPEKLPFPEQLLITPASVNDLAVFKDAWANIKNRSFLETKFILIMRFFQT